MIDCPILYSLGRRAFLKVAKDAAADRKNRRTAAAISADEFEKGRGGGKGDMDEDDDVQKREKRKSGACIFFSFSSVIHPSILRI